MTISIANNFDGPNGTAISVANSGGALGDAWTGVNFGGGNMAYDTGKAALGTASGKVTSVASALTFVSKAFASAQTTSYVRFYLHLNAVNFNQARRLLVLNTGGTSGTIVAAIRLRADGKIDLQPNGVANVAISTTTIPTTGWVRLELQTVHSTTVGSMTLRIYSGVDPHTETITETLTCSAQNTGASSDALRLGAVTSIAGTADVFWFDQFAVAYDAWPGSAVPPGANANLEGSGSLTAAATVSTPPPAEITLRNTFNGSNGVAVSVANSGGALGDPWSGINLGGGQLIYSSDAAAAGSASMRVTSAASALTFVSKALGASLTTSYFRFYLRLSGALPNQPRRLLVLNTGGTSGTLVAAVRLRSDGKIDLEPNGVDNVAVSTTVLPVNTWVRLEIKTVHSATVGQMTCRIYAGGDPHSATITETLATNALQNTGANADAIRLGTVTSIAGTADTLYFDEFGASSVDWIGPALVSIPAAVAMAGAASMGSTATQFTGTTATGRVHYMAFTANAADPTVVHDFYKLVGTEWKPCVQYVLRGGQWV